MIQKLIKPKRFTVSQWQTNFQFSILTADPHDPIEAIRIWNFVAMVCANEFSEKLSYIF